MRAVSRLSGLASCLVSAGRVRTTVSRSAPRSSREACSARAAALARRRRASCAETAMWEGHCYLHGPSHQGSHPRLSPWLRPSANVSRLEAPFCCCFMARARATLNEQCQPSEGEALLNWSNSVEASRAVLRIPQNHTARPRAFWARCGYFAHTTSHKAALLSAPASSRHALLVSQAPHAIKAIGEASNCCNRPSQRAGEHHRRANQRTRCATGQQN